MRFDKVYNHAGEELEFRCEACNKKMEVVIYNEQEAVVVLRCKECDSVVSRLEEELDELKADLRNAEEYNELYRDAIKKAFYVLEDYA